MRTHGSRFVLALSMSVSLVFVAWMLPVKDPLTTLGMINILLLRPLNALGDAVTQVQRGPLQSQQTYVLYLGLGACVTVWTAVLYTLFALRDLTLPRGAGFIPQTGFDRPAR